MTKRNRIKLDREDLEFMTEKQCDHRRLRPMPNEKELIEMCLAEMKKAVPEIVRAVREQAELVARWRNLPRRPPWVVENKDSK